MNNSQARTHYWITEDEIATPKDVNICVEAYLSQHSHEKKNSMTILSVAHRIQCGNNVTNKNKVIMFEMYVILF